MSESSRDEIKQEILNEGFSFFGKILSVIKNNIVLVTLFTTLISFLVGNFIHLAIYIYNMGIYQYFKIPFSLISDSPTGFLNSVFIGFVFNLVPMIIGLLCGYDKKRSKPYFVVILLVGIVIVALYIYSLINPAFALPNAIGFNDIYSKIFVDIPLVLEIAIALIAARVGKLFFDLHDLRTAKEQLLAHDVFMSQMSKLRLSEDNLEIIAKIIEQHPDDEAHIKRLEDETAKLKEMDDEVLEMDNRFKEISKNYRLLKQRGIKDIIARMSLFIIIVIVCAGFIVAIIGTYRAHTITQFGIVSLEEDSTFAILHEDESSYYIVQCAIEQDALIMQPSVSSYISKQSVFVAQQQFQKVTVQ